MTVQETNEYRRNAAQVTARKTTSKPSVSFHFRELSSAGPFVLYLNQQTCAASPLCAAEPHAPLLRV